MNICYLDMAGTDPTSHLRDAEFTGNWYICQTNQIKPDDKGKLYLEVYTDSYPLPVYKNVKKRFLFWVYNKRVTSGFELCRINPIYIREDLFVEREYCYE